MTEGILAKVRVLASSHRERLRTEPRFDRRHQHYALFQGPLHTFHIRTNVSEELCDRDSARCCLRTIPMLHRRLGLRTARPSQGRPDQVN